MSYDMEGRLAAVGKFIRRIGANGCPRKRHACDGKALTDAGLADIGRCGYYKGGRCTHPAHPDVYHKMHRG